MSLSYLVDSRLSTDVSPSQVREDLAAWLASHDAALETASFGPIRVTWSERFEAQNRWCARLVVSDTVRGEETRALFCVEDDAMRLRLERQSLQPLDGVRNLLPPAPDFLSRWLEDRERVGVVSSTEGLDTRGDLVVISAGDLSSTAVGQLVSEIGRYVLGMASIVPASIELFESLAIAAGISSDARVGSVLVLTRRMGTPKGYLLPSTVATRNPTAAARRILQTVLSHASLTPSEKWLSLDEQLAATTDDSTDSVLDGLIQAETLWVGERSQLHRQLQMYLVETSDLVVERANDAEEIDRLRSHVRVLQRELSRVNAYPIAEPEADELDRFPDSCVELIDVARDVLSHLFVTADLAPAEMLDEHARSLDWARRLWTMLRGLNDYAEIVSSGNFTGGIADYCRNPPSGVLPLAWGKVSLRESESTMSRPHCVKARTFRVPTSVNLSGEALMMPHLKIDIVTPAPRAHFLDATRQIGKIVVGYIGPHLPLD